MATQHIEAEALVKAPATQVYALIADYNTGHPRILPKPPFVSLGVDEGGVGAGTKMHFTTRVMGQTRTLHSIVTEPEPGRVLVETNEDGGVSTFTVEPRDGGQHAFVRIESDLPVPDGLAGKIQAWLIKRILQPTYGREIAQLEAVAIADSR